MLPMEEGSSESSLDEEEVPAATRIRSISVQTDDGARTHTVILEEYDELLSSRVDTLYTFWDNMTHYKTESVHFLGLMN